MTDLQKIDHILRHIDAVEVNLRLLGTRLIERGEVKLGIQLISNSRVHDQSKFSGIEFDFLPLKKSELDEAGLNAFALAVKHHNHTNRHHPEYWGGVKNMPRVYIGEMLSDWKTRASEFGTSLKDYINGDAAKRYGFDARDAVYESIMYFHSLLCDEPFQPLRPEGH